MSAVNNKLSEIDFYAPDRVAFGAVDYEPGGAFGPRTQQDVQLVILDRGSLRLATDGRERVVEPGEVACQWPDGLEYFRFDDARPSAHRWVAMSFDTSPPARQWMQRQRQGTSALPRETAMMRRLFDTAIAMRNRDDPAQKTARVYLAMAYFNAFRLADAGEPRAAGAALPPALPPALVAMQEAIETRYAQPLVLDDLAEAASRSTNHLVRLCRKHLDTTPMRLLWDSRVDRGVELLRSSGLQVGEIAYRVGFANPFHFSRLCKAKYGVSPRKLRQDAWGMP